MFFLNIWNYPIIRHKTVSHGKMSFLSFPQVKMAMKETKTFQFILPLTRC